MRQSLARPVSDDIIPAQCFLLLSPLKFALWKFQETAAYRTSRQLFFKPIENKTSTENCSHVYFLTGNLHWDRKHLSCPTNAAVTAAAMDLLGSAPPISMVQIPEAGFAHHLSSPAPEHLLSTYSPSPTTQTLTLAMGIMLL